MRPKHIVGKRISLQVRLPDELHSRLVKLSIENNRSLNGEIIMALEKYVHNTTSQAVKRDWFIPYARKEV
jgi:predicted HicB family RNase H-like nuclease